ncbi:MAG: tryptophan--tRNA ligase [Eggerthellaceae bacterium]|nr:tryptophan--tRNA ligase [Eggerthellaceae bacterium]
MKHDVSNEDASQVPKVEAPPTILTGDRPTGKLHLGHYVGSLRERVRLQNSGEYEKIFIMIADAQALTDNADNPEKVRQNIIEVALDYFSCGIDPEKTTVLIQSQVPQLYELTAYYMNLVTVARVQRNPTVKSEIQMRGFNADVPVGFFTYPISQASDITAFKATTVPVGEDQLPMLEQTREIVRSFNRTYGPVLVEPEALIPSGEAAKRLPGLDGKSKMSKSLNNGIYLSDSPDTIADKIKQMYTDEGHLRIDDPGKVEGNAVFTYLDAFCEDRHFEAYLPEYANLSEMKEHYRRGGLGDVKCKKLLQAVLEETLEPIRARRHEFEADIPGVYQLLEQGCETARAVAAETLDQVKDAMKINYFSDASLIEEQVAAYAKGGER